MHHFWKKSLLNSKWQEVDEAVWPKVAVDSRPWFRFRTPILTLQERLVGLLWRATDLTWLLLRSPPALTMGAIAARSHNRLKRRSYLINIKYASKSTSRPFHPSEHLEFNFFQIKLLTRMDNKNKLIGLVISGILVMVLLIGFFAVIYDLYNSSLSDHLRQTPK